MGLNVFGTSMSGLSVKVLSYRLEHKLAGQSFVEIKSIDLPGSCRTV